MYSTCLFCNASLGANEELEIFPVGKRLAFDAAKGRLWVICRKCERWNLTPLEERWEAVEECERRFRGTRLRVSSDNIGLARLASGLELVRVGAALRPELAAWRYGDQFSRRRRRFVLGAVGVTVAGTAAMIAGPMIGLVSGTTALPLLYTANVWNGMYRNRKILHIPRERGATLSVRAADVQYACVTPQFRSWSLVLTAIKGEPRVWQSDDAMRVELEGAEALHGAAVLMAHVNQRGGGKKDIGNAVELLNDAKAPNDVFRSVTKLAERMDARRPRMPWTNLLSTRRTMFDRLDRLPLPVRLALEIAANEESERRAMAGELALLEAAWRRAEEVAAIADDFFTPSASRKFIHRNRK